VSAPSIMEDHLLNKLCASLLASQALQNCMCSTSLAEVYFREACEAIIFSWSFSHKCTSARLVAQVSLTKIYLCEKPHESILAREASQKYTWFTSLAEVELVHKPHESILDSQALRRYTCARYLIKVYLCDKPYGSILAREASRKYTCSRSFTNVYFVHKLCGSILVQEAS